MRMPEEIMETYISLYKPFLHGIYHDICDLYSDEISSEVQLGCHNIIDLMKIEDVQHLCSIGKMIEVSLIDGSKLPIKTFPRTFSSPGLSELFYNDEGFPRLLQNCFERLFRKSGAHAFRDFDLTDALVDHNEEHMFNEMAKGSEVHIEFLNYVGVVMSPALKQSYALAIYCLRQLYLGLSKISTWECLRRRGVGDSSFQVESYNAVGLDRDNVLSYTSDCETFNRECFLRLGFRLVVSVC